MKRQAFILLFAFVCSLAHAEHSLDLSQEIPPESTQVFTATDHILLSPGFKSEPQNGNTVLFTIDALDTSPPMLGITGGPFFGDDGVVGALKGHIDVSSLGAATYSLPIELPQGLGGLTPQLSVYYNSQQRNGLLGWGWDLGGVSAITRVSSNIYYDGHVDPVNYSDDQFCLDGQRLLKTGNGNNSTEDALYRTEQDQMSKIVSYTLNSINGPAYFRIWTADGKILSYGNSDDSRALKSTSNHINIWLLKSIEDRYGNKITYHYQNDPHSYRLSHISYSGNDIDDLDPAFSVTFQYDNRDDVEIVYHGDRMQKKNVLLSSITVYNKSYQMALYRFNYKKPDLQSGYPYHLLESIQCDVGNQHLNPTKIQWGDNNYNIPMINTTNVQVTTNSIDNAFAGAIKFPGDFNGDGFTDVIAVRPLPNGSYRHQADLFLNRGLSNGLKFNFVRSFELSENMHWIYVADFNGDGRDDILLTDRMRAAGPIPDFITSSLYLSTMHPNGIPTFTKHELNSYPIRNNLQESLIIGDFFGEGQQSILIQSLKPNKGDERSILIHYKHSDNSFQCYEFDEHLEANRFYPADYNGDGATEILYKNPQGYTTISALTWENELPHYSQCYSGYPSQWDDCFPGDFNADGCCDLLFYKQSATHPWFVNLSSNIGPTPEIYSIASFPYESPGNYQFSLDQPNETYQHIKIGDFDGNGCSDLALCVYDTLHLFFGPIIPNNNYAPFAYSRHLSTTLIHYFSNMDICLGNYLGRDNLSFLGNYSLSHLPSMAPRHEVAQITDGMGKKLVFQYDYLSANPKNPSENDFYYMTSISSYPNNDVFVTPLPIRALKKITTYNINNKPESFECQYQGVLVNKLGKGLLGFSKTIQKDYRNNVLQKRTERHFDIVFCEQVIHPMLLEEETFNKNGERMADAFYSNLLYLNDENSKVFIPLTNKTLCEYDPDNPDNLIRKEIQETTIDPHHTGLFKYNNTISVIEVKKGVTDKPNVNTAGQCDYLTKTITDYYANVINSWLINRPKMITEIHHHAGDDTDITHSRRITYNPSSPYQVESVIEIPGDGTNVEHPLTKKTEYQYDLTGNIISSTTITPYDDVPSRTETFEYGRMYGRRLLTEHTNAEGQVTKYKYHPVYNYRISMIDCNLLETQYEQDPFGMTQTTTHPDGTTTTKALRWGHGGYYLWEKSTGQATTINDYALTGENTRKQSYAINGDLIKTVMEYDDYGRKVKETLIDYTGRSLQTIEYEYDKHHRIAGVKHSDGTHETILHEGNCTTASYHGLDGNLQTESKTVNAMGWVIRSTDAEGNSVVYEHYPDGKPKWAQIEGQEETRIEFNYDANGNRTSLLDPDYGLTTDVYNAYGELTCQTAPNQVTTHYRYDKLGNTIRREETDNNSGQSSVTEWTYGSIEGQKGLLLRVKNDEQDIHYKYDSFLHLQAIIESRDNDLYKTLFEYDKASRIASTTYPTEIAVHYTYDSEGRMRCISDQTGNILWKLRESNALGLPIKLSTGDGFVSHYEYDPNNNRLIALKTLFGEKVVQEYRYDYDDYANMTKRQDYKNGIIEQFSYDQLNRLIASVDEHGESLYSYDPLGRMTEKTRAGETIFANANYAGSKPHAIKSAQSPQGTFPQERMELEYTSFGKVAAISEGDNLVSFRYGYDRQRIQMSENLEGKTRKKTYVSNCEFITQAGAQDIERTFLSCPTGVFAVAETKNGKTTLYYIHKDHLGSWTLISDSKGNIRQENRFDAWGNCSNSDSLLLDRGFAGHEHIRGMNIINMNGRLYDPLTSSMISPDANIQAPDFTQNFNRYAYCLNNPLTYIDPDGNSFIETALICYLVFCTDFGYELQKESLPLALHLDLHLSTEQLGIGMDVSVGAPREFPLSVRLHGGGTYYWKYYDNSYKGWEFRAGAEIYAGGVFGLSGTKYYSGSKTQVTNTISIGGKFFKIDYENDYMFNIANEILGFPKADNGDRYRSAAVKVRYGLFSLGLNMFTGDPGVNHSDRMTFIDPCTNRETYTINANGDDPDAYRAGVLYVGMGPIRIGWNSEGIRNFFQNRFAHDWLCHKSSPYFKTLDRPGIFYFHFGSSTGNSLW